MQTLQTVTAHEIVDGSVSRPEVSIMVHLIVAMYLLHYPIVQDEKNLCDAAESGNVSVVRRIVATHVNVDCTPYQVL